MSLSEHLSIEGVFPDLHPRCKREALCQLAAEAAEITGLPVETIEDALMARERLGSTGVGRGVAIPHGKIAGLDKIVALFARLPTPIDFDAVDDEPVDIIFVLLAPEDATAAHLRALAKASRLLREQAVRDAVRGADTSEALYAIATESAQSDAA